MGSEYKVLQGGVLPESTRKKPRQALRKVEILGTIKMSTYKPNQQHLDRAVGAKESLAKLDKGSTTIKSIRVG